MNNNREKEVVKASIISIISNIVLAGFKAFVESIKRYMMKYKINTKITKLI